MQWPYRMPDHLTFNHCYFPSDRPLSHFVFCTYYIARIYPKITQLTHLGLVYTKLVNPPLCPIQSLSRSFSRHHSKTFSRDLLKIIPNSRLYWVTTLSLRGNVERNENMSSPRQLRKTKLIASIPTPSANNQENQIYKESNDYLLKSKLHNVRDVVCNICVYKKIHVSKEYTNLMSNM